MSISKNLGGSVLLATMVVLGSVSSAQAYGPEGLFGGRGQPDGSLVMYNPTALTTDRPDVAESVLRQSRPDYEAAPIAIGSFELYPTLEIDENYDSNIYATHSDHRDDMIGTARPILDLFSNWDKHAMSITTFGDINYFSQHADENYQNGVLDVNGRYDLSHRTWIAANAGYQHLAEMRSSIDNSFGSKPTIFNVAKADLTGYHSFGKTKLTTSYDLRRFDFDDVPSSEGDIDKSNRDRINHVFDTKLAYRLDKNFMPYIRGAYNIRDYDHNALHSSDGYEVVVGTAFDYRRDLSIDLFAGWMVQDYDNFTGYTTVSTPKLGGRADWNFTPKSTLTVEADRTIEDTTSTGETSYTQTGGSLTLTHELYGNLLVEANSAYSHLDFNGVTNIQDDTVRLGAGLRFLINRNLYSDLIYSYDRRYSTDAAADYARNVVTARIGVHM